MNREQTLEACINAMDKHKYIICELPTGFGKSRIALEMAEHALGKDDSLSILLLVAKTVHKATWEKEIKKWVNPKKVNALNITIECYESMKKYRNETFDIVIFDEMQHLQSDTRIDLFESLNIKKFVFGLSATIPRILKDYFRYNERTRNQYIFVKASLQDAMNEKVLPTPKIILMPLVFDEDKTELVEQSPSHDIYITKKDYLNKLNLKIEWTKNAYLNRRDQFTKIKWLSLCGSRLRWLSNQKTAFVQDLLKVLNKKRTLTFCNSINQTEILGKYCINSKNVKSKQYFDDFNNKKIRHITSCNILNEGVNLKSCQYGIFANLNSSEIITKQRQGRLLRHPHPYFIIPYFVGTRDEELVLKMIKDYDRSLLHKCSVPITVFSRKGNSANIIKIKRLLSEFL